MVGSKLATGISSFWGAYNRRRYATLFYALLFTLIAVPVGTTLGWRAVLIKLIVGACLLAALMPNATLRNRRILFVGVVILIAARIASEEGILPLPPGLTIALVGIVGLAAAAGSLRFAVSAQRVGSEILYAATSTYLLAGLFCGQMYWSLERLQPGSIVGPEPMSEQAAVYYSFVTLATLGYGDILPRTDLARGLATLEVVGGQLFLAVMVARLIGAFETDKGIL